MRDCVCGAAPKPAGESSSLRGTPAARYPAGSKTRPRAWGLQRLEVLDHRPALLLGQLVAEGVAGVAAAGLRRVVDLAAFQRHGALVRAALEDRHLPADLDRIIIL